MATSDSEDEHNDTPPLYCYEPLPNKRPVHHIRVLKFVRQSSASNNEIACELVPFDIELKQKYCAISWAWGKRDDDDKRDIIIRQNNQDCIFKIPPTLLDALHVFRDSKIRTLWIDYICINQEDDKEKSHQIPMMSEIYGRARKVCVWLGPSDTDSDTAIRFIKEELSQLKNFDKLCEQSPDEWRAILNFAQRGWFTRRWVIQEISVAVTAELHCGKQHIDWRDFADAIQLVLGSPSATTKISTAIQQKEPQLSDWFEGFETIGASLIVDATTTMFRRSGNHIKTPVLPLEYLVSKLYFFDVTEPRDAIYSLLALARDVQASADKRQVQNKIPHVVNDWVKRSLKATYLVDYAQPYRDVCRDYISFCVETAEDFRALDVICRPWAFAPKMDEDDKIMPSWVPQQKGTPYSLYMHGSFERKVVRKNADMLVGLPAPEPRTYSAAGTLSLRPKKIKFKVRNKYTSMFVSGFILDQVKAVYDDARSGNIPEDWLGACGWTSLSGDPPEHFWRTLVGNRDKHGHNPPLYFKKACKESITRDTLAGGGVNTSEFIKEGSSSVISEFYRRVQAVIYNRRLVNTRGGRIGLVHKDVKAGDRICILYGCSVPVVLRPSKKTAREIEEEKKADREDALREMKEALARVYEIFRTEDRFRERKAPTSAKKTVVTPPTTIAQTTVEQIPQTPKSPPATKPKPVAFRRPTLPETSPTKTQNQEPPNNTTSIPPLKISANLSAPDQPIPNGGLSPTTRERRPSVQRERSREMLQVPEMQDLARWIELEGQDGEDSELWYKFCGECYLHGMMDGEAVEFKNDYSQVKRHYFELR